jgi:hypothetical protein
VALQHSARRVLQSLTPLPHLHPSASPSVCGIRLYAESHNGRAHATYTKCGMTETDYRIFEIDYVISRAQGPA